MNKADNRCRPSARSRRAYDSNPPEESGSEQDGGGSTCVRFDLLRSFPPFPQLPNTDFKKALRRFLTPHEAHTTSICHQPSRDRNRGARQKDSLLSCGAITIYLDTNALFLRVYYIVYSTKNTKTAQQREALGKAARGLTTTSRSRSPNKVQEVRAMCLHGNSWRT